MTSLLKDLFGCVKVAVHSAQLVDTYKARNGQAHTRAGEFAVHDAREAQQAACDAKAGDTHLSRVAVTDKCRLGQCVVPVDRKIFFAWNCIWPTDIAPRQPFLAVKIMLC